MAIIKSIESVLPPSIVSPPPAPTGDHAAPPTDLKVPVPSQHHQQHAQPSASPKIHSPLQTEASAEPEPPLNPFTEAWQSPIPISTL